MQTLSTNEWAKTLEKGCYHIEFYANIHFYHDWTFAHTHQTFLFSVAHLQMQPLKRKLLQKSKVGLWALILNVSSDRMSIAPFSKRQLDFFICKSFKEKYCIRLAKYFDSQNCIFFERWHFSERNDFFHTAHIMTLSVRTVNTSRHDKTSIPCICSLKWSLVPCPNLDIDLNLRSMGTLSARYTLMCCFFHDVTMQWSGL